MCVFISCQKETSKTEPETSDLKAIYSRAENDANNYFYSLLENDNFTYTKSSDDDNGLIVPAWAYPYIEAILNAEDIAKPNELSLIDALNNDILLSNEQKEYIAYLSGVLGYILEDAFILSEDTKSSPLDLDHNTSDNQSIVSPLSQDECLSIYKQQVKEILVTDISVGAIGGGVIGGAIGFELGVIGGLISSWREIKQAGREYIRCIA